VIDFIKDSMKYGYQKTKQALANAWDFTCLFCKALMKNYAVLLKSWQPVFDVISNAFNALVTFFSTLKSAIHVMPVILSIMTVLSTAPLFHFILPSVVLEPLIIAPVLLGISIFAGISTYRDSVERARLDKLIEEGQRLNQKLSHRIDRLESRLKRHSDLHETNTEPKKVYYLRAHKKIPVEQYQKPKALHTEHKKYTARR
jgi:hypothetical protein